MILKFNTTQDFSEVCLSLLKKKCLPECQIKFLLAFEVRFCRTLDILVPRVYAYCIYILYIYIYKQCRFRYNRIKFPLKKTQTLHILRRTITYFSSLIMLPAGRRLHCVFYTKREFNLLLNSYPKYTVAFFLGVSPMSRHIKQVLTYIIHVCCIK